TSASGYRLSGTLLPMSFQEGDRLIVEVGYQAENDEDDPYTGRIYHGGESSTDLSPGDTNFDHPGYVQFQVTPGVEFSEPVDTSNPPGSVYDLTNWKWQGPIGEPDDPDEMIEVEGEGLT